MSRNMQFSKALIYINFSVKRLINIEIRYKLCLYLLIKRIANAARIKVNPFRCREVLLITENFGDHVDNFIPIPRSVMRVNLMVN